MKSRTKKLAIKYFFESAGLGIGLYLAFLPVCIIISTADNTLMPFVITTTLLLILSVVSFIEALGQTKQYINKENLEILNALKDK